MNKYEIRAQKEKERAIKRTLRKARVPKDATPEQVKAYLVHYVSRLKKDFYKLRFTDEQLSDPNFLLSLYRANIKMLLHSAPNPEIEELQSNVDFMIEYLKLKQRRETMMFTNKEGSWSQTNLEWATEKYNKAMANPEFIVRLAETFPNHQIIPLIKRSLMPYRWFGNDVKEKEAQDQARYKECLSNLPTEFLCDQVRKYTWRVLNEIPNDIPNFNQLVSAGIEIDGFRSLGRLDITQVLDNRDLIIQAYEKDGIQALAGYIQHTLSPMRTHNYMCHGEEHDYTEYDKRYEEVQKALMSDTKIQYIFKKEEQLAKAREEQKRVQPSSTPTQTSAEEDTLIK